MKSVLIVGLGSIGRRHAKILIEKGITNITGVDLRDDRIEQAKKEIGISKFEKNYVKALEGNNYDAVFITLPTAYHTPVIIEAAKRKSNLFIEKPVAADLKNIREALKVVENNKVLSYTAYCYRFAPSAIRVKQLVNDGRIGKILSSRIKISTYLPDWHPWEDYRDFYMSKIEQGGGARLDESHGVDLIRWIVGEIESVYSLVEKVSKLEITADDLTVMIFKFKNGSVGEAHFDLLGRTPRIDLELIGSLGTLLWDRITGEVSLYESSKGEWILENFGKEDFVKSYANQIDHVIESFDNNLSPECDLKDGIITLKVLEAALRSSESKKVINISDINI